LSKILVFGGAFNPPTKAHVLLANQARIKVDFDKVMFVPSKMTYIKDDQGKDYAYSDDDRYEMLSLLAREHDWLEVSDYELKCDKQPRTYQTLKYLKELGYECKLLFGSDKLMELESGWKNVEDICQEFGIVCMVRNFDDVDCIVSENEFLTKLKPYITFVHTSDEYQSVSSSKVRAYLRNKEMDRVKENVPSSIYEYLERKIK